MTGVIHQIQLELFEVEAAISEFERRRKDLKAKLVRAGAGTKTCTKCGEEMDIEQFYRDRQKLDRRDSWCCECRKSDVTERQKRNRAA